MKIICKNCKNEFVGHYCNNCGQEADTKKINWTYVWKEIHTSFFPTDKGLLYTAKALFTKPGHFIREYIQGKRIKHFKPIPLLILVASVYGFLYHYFKIGDIPEMQVGHSEKKEIDFVALNDWLGSHVSIFNLLAMPLYAFGSFVAFKNQGYNFTEHFILNTYLTSQRMFVSIVTFPILYNLNETHHLKSFNAWAILLNAVLMIWTFTQFFNKLSFLKSLFLSLLSYTIFWLSVLLVMYLTLTTLGY